MRLIDAEALKKAIDTIKQTGYDNDNEPLFEYVDLLDLVKEIDNAPTVTPTFGLFRDMLCSDCEKRPQGEWIPCKSTRTGQITNIDYKCSECSHHKDRPVPYCEICGAKMKGGAEK